MNEKIVMTVVLVLLIGISAVQAVQLNDLKGDLQEGQITASSSSASSSRVTATTTTKDSGAVPKSLQNLPQMVGGC